MKSFNVMSSHMVQIVANLMLAGFSYKEGQAMFRAMADIMEHITETNGLVPDALDAEILEAKFKGVLEMTPEETDHIAFSIMHGSFVEGQGGCSCTGCTAIRESIDRQCKEEADKFYNEHYPPPGGVL